MGLGLIRRAADVRAMESRMNVVLAGAAAGVSLSLVAVAVGGFGGLSPPERRFGDDVAATPNATLADALIARSVELSAWLMCYMFAVFVATGALLHLLLKRTLARTQRRQLAALARGAELSSGGTADARRATESRALARAAALKTELARASIRILVRYALAGASVAIMNGAVLSAMVDAGNRYNPARYPVYAVSVTQIVATRYLLASLTHSSPAPVERYAWRLSLLLSAPWWLFPVFIESFWVLQVSRYVAGFFDPVLTFLAVRPAVGRLLRSSHDVVALRTQLDVHDPEAPVSHFEQRAWAQTTRAVDIMAVVMSASVLLLHGSTAGLIYLADWGLLPDYLHRAFSSVTTLVVEGFALPAFVLAVAVAAQGSQYSTLLHATHARAMQRQVVQQRALHRSLSKQLRGPLATVAVACDVMQLPGECGGSGLHEALLAGGTRSPVSGSGVSGSGVSQGAAAGTLTPTATRVALEFVPLRGVSGPRHSGGDPARAPAPVGGGVASMLHVDSIAAAGFSDGAGSSSVMRFRPGGAAAPRLGGLPPLVTARAHAPSTPSAAQRPGGPELAAMIAAATMDCRDVLDNAEVREQLARGRFCAERTRFDAASQFAAVVAACRTKATAAGVSLQSSSYVQAPLTRDLLGAGQSVAHITSVLLRRAIAVSPSGSAVRATLTLSFHATESPEQPLQASSASGARTQAGAAAGGFAGRDGSASTSASTRGSSPLTRLLRGPHAYRPAAQTGVEVSTPPPGAGAAAGARVVPTGRAGGAPTPAATPSPAFRRSTGSSAGRDGDSDSLAGESGSVERAAHKPVACLAPPPARTRDWAVRRRPHRFVLLQMAVIDAGGGGGGGVMPLPNRSVSSESARSLGGESSGVVTLDHEAGAHTSSARGGNAAQFSDQVDTCIRLTHELGGVFGVWPVGEAGGGGGGGGAAAEGMCMWFEVCLRCAVAENLQQEWDPIFTPSLEAPATGSVVPESLQAMLAGREAALLAGRVVCVATRDTSFFAVARRLFELAGAAQVHRTPTLDSVRATVAASAGRLGSGALGGAGPDPILVSGGVAAPDGVSTSDVGGSYQWQPPPQHLHGSASHVGGGPGTDTAGGGGETVPHALIVLDGDDRGVLSFALAAAHRDSDADQQLDAGSAEAQGANRDSRGPGDDDASVERGSSAGEVDALLGLGGGGAGGPQISLRDVPVVGVASDLRNDEHALHAAGCDVVLPKPAFATTLLRACAEAILQKQGL